MNQAFLPAMPRGFSPYGALSIPPESQDTGNGLALVRNGRLPISPQYDFLYIQPGALPTPPQSSGAERRRKKQG